jgi:hypothetical protein
LENVSGNVTEKISYILSIKGYALYRMDFYCYLYTYQDKSLRDISENVMIVTYMISSIKYDTIDRETLFAIICTQISDDETQKKIYEKLNAIYNQEKHIMIENMEKAYV